MVTSLARSTKAAKPTAFHHLIATLAQERRLLRLYTQNVDSLDTGLEPLPTRVPFAKNEDGKWPITVQLHGSLEKMNCSKCHKLFDFDVELFEEAGAMPPACPSCETVNSVRTDAGMRSHGVGRLRPRMVLYNEEHPDADAIGSVTKYDLNRRPDAVIVVGTTLKVPGVQRIVTEMCNTVRDRKDGGLAIWINQEPPPTLKGFSTSFDLVVLSDCDEVARRAAMPKWNELPLVDDYSEVSDEDAVKAAAKTGAVIVPKTPSRPKPTCMLTHANLERLPTAAHVNNSFRPPLVGATPTHLAESGPDDWSPLTSRRSSVLPSIETADGTLEGENITVADGLLTPTKSRKSTSSRSTPAKKMATINETLKDSGDTKKPGPKKTKAAPKPRRKANVKYVKKSKPAATKAKAGPQLPAPTSNALTKNFATTKTASIAAKNSDAWPKKGLPSPARTPSNLRVVENASETLGQVPSKDVRVNTSPSKKAPFFPGLTPDVAPQLEGYMPGVRRKSLGF
jgi:NAD-dependent SIR2 family protein deacetylase